MILIISLYFSFLLTALLVLIFMKIGRRLGMVDKPNHRKVHQKPIPRTGGAAIIIGTLIPLVFLFRNDQIILGVCLGAICILLVGILDDLWGLNYKWKLLGQILAATVTLLVSGIRFHTLGELWPGYMLDFGMLSLPLSIFFVVATTNMINLSDGLDGLAGGICLLIFSAIGFLSYFQGDFLTLALCVACGGAIAGFLRYNTHPAIVFMGDTGSQFLGFLVAVTAILLTQVNSIYSPAIVLYILGIPALDLVVVIFERVMNRRPIFRANNDHLHHKLLKLGFQHSEAVVVIYVMQLVMILIAWNQRFANDLILLASYFCLLVLLLATSALHRKRSLPIPSIHKQLNPMNKGIIDEKWQLFSRKTISKLTWYGLVFALFLFYFVSPLVIESLPSTIIFISLSMVLFFLVPKRLQAPLIELMLMIFLYLIGVYYVFIMEYGINVIHAQLITNSYNILFIVIGVLYTGYVVTTFERIPFSTINCLLLAVVIFLFCLPKSYLVNNHLHIIAAKVFLIFLFIDLLFYKIRKESMVIIKPRFLTLILKNIKNIVAFLH